MLTRVFHHDKKTFILSKTSHSLAHHDQQRVIITIFTVTIIINITIRWSSSSPSPTRQHHKYRKITSQSTVLKTMHRAYDLTRRHTCIRDNWRGGRGKMGLRWERWADRHECVIPVNNDFFTCSRHFSVYSAFSEEPTHEGR